MKAGLVARAWTRALTDTDLADGVRRSSMAELAYWTLWAERVVTF